MGGYGRGGYGGQKPVLHGPPIDSYCWLNAARDIFGATGIGALLLFAS